MKLIFFLLLIGLGLFTVFMLQIPNVLVTIRWVDNVRFYLNHLLVYC